MLAPFPPELLEETPDDEPECESPPSELFSEWLFTEPFEEPEPAGVEEVLVAGMPQDGGTCDWLTTTGAGVVPPALEALPALEVDCEPLEPEPEEGRVEGAEEPDEDDEVVGTGEADDGTEEDGTDEVEPEEPGMGTEEPEEDGIGVAEPDEVGPGTAEPAGEGSCAPEPGKFGIGPEEPDDEGKVDGGRLGPEPTEDGMRPGT
ncbi:MAG: hypothetical protein JSS83_24800 [Cyanobacteria bacterium SZAS LIN-3]|nr:hypothetical protein [Cyanobacteria bacterium SZAS LIN-3]